MIDKSARPLRSRTSLIALPIVALLLVPTVGCSSKPEETPKAVVEVQAAKAERKDLEEHVEGDAVLAPLAQAAIVPKVTQGQSQLVAVEGVPDIGKRLLPPGGIKRTVVDRSNQVRQGLRRYCIGH